jgi:hypothetical protein
MCTPAVPASTNVQSGNNAETRKRVTSSQTNVRVNSRIPRNSERATIQETHILASLYDLRGSL